MVDTIDSALRDNNTLGDPGSGDYKVKKGPLRTVLKRIEASAGIGAVTVATKAELDAITDKADNAPGFVVGDSTASNNGQYTWDDSGSAWVKVRDLPDTATILESVAGTNDVTANVATGVNPAAVSLFVLTPANTNTGAMTLAIEGETAQGFKTYAGDDFASGAIVAGRAYLVFDTGLEYRALNDDRILPFRGAYAAPTTYSLGDLAENGGSIWYSLQDDNIGNTPSEGAYWTEFLPGVTVADGSVTTAKLADNSVTNAKLTADSVSSDKKTAATIAKDEGFDDIAAFIADTGLTYTASQSGTVVSGDIILAGGYRLEVVASGASDNHLANSNGTPVKVKVLKRNNTWPMLAFNPNADGTTDDKAKIDLVNNSGEVVDLGGKSYEYGGVFTPAATFTNGSIIDDNRTRDYNHLNSLSSFAPTQPRWRANYGTATKLRCHGGENVVMAGFRYMGAYKKAGPVYPTGVNGYVDIDAADGADLGAETTRQLECWYAAFAVANDEDSVCSFKLMPYVRTKSIAGSVVTLGEGGRGKSLPLSAETFAWADDALVGVECLVINENTKFSGRVTTITANTATTITLDDATGVTDGDYLLPAPPGFDHYAWLVDSYMDTAEWTNLADTGGQTGATGPELSGFPASGAVSATAYSVAGYISPLATAAVIQLGATLTTASTGTFRQDLWHDTSNHPYWFSFDHKVTTAASETFYYGGVVCPFSIRQEIVYKTSGTLEADRTFGKILFYGWIVP